MTTTQKIIFTPAAQQDKTVEGVSSQRPNETDLGYQRRIQDTTASASQNRETALVNGVKYVITGRLNDASVIQRPNGSKMYLALPANDGKDGIYGANRYRIIRPLSYGESFDDSSAKPADAHAVSAHTPKDNDHNLKFYSEREHIRQQNETSAWQAEALEVDLLRARLAETAAERDRLKEAIMTTEAVRLQETHRAIKAEGERDRLKWEMGGYREVATQLESECDQAREQVQTLANLVVELQEQLDFMRGERDCLLAACRKIASLDQLGITDSWRIADNAIARVERK